jgi:hypothetical protein
MTNSQRNAEMRGLETKVAKFQEIHLIYRGIKNVPTNKTWIEICEQHETLLKSVIRYDYLKQCSYSIK